MPRPEDGLLSHEGKQHSPLFVTVHQLYAYNNTGSYDFY